jgi:MoaA/NifB/PqqE/SkfB family radical SAM enzyme
MIKTTAITLIKPEPMMVTWDIGRRCNYDCTYCESTRHDNGSSFTTLEQLIGTFDFIKQWTSKYNSHRKDINETSINFTGGEPTINPNFWQLVDHIKLQPEKYNLSLTTNGSWGPIFTNRIAKEFNGVTISYHAEASPEFKKRVIDNIITLSNTSIWLQVNVMLHVDYWDECIEVCNLLKEKGIRYNPRPIGDGNIERKGWFIDSDGSQRRTSHTYTAEQKQWFFEHNGIKNAPSESSEGTNLGRACCGGRCLTGKVDGQWQPIKLVNTEFKDWSCMVDWYFLHIDQHTGLVYHHQTCQATHTGNRGAIGNIAESHQMLAELDEQFKNPTAIVCPNQRCGCGMCIPKARDQKDFVRMWNELTDLSLG